MNKDIIPCIPCIEFNSLINKEYIPKLRRGEYSVFADFYFLSRKYEEEIDTSMRERMLPVCRRCNNLSIYDKEKLDELKKASGRNFNAFLSLKKIGEDVNNIIIDNFFKNLRKINKENEIFGRIIICPTFKEICVADYHGYIQDIAKNFSSDFAEADLGLPSDYNLRLIKKYREDQYTFIISGNDNKRIFPEFEFNLILGVSGNEPERVYQYMLEFNQKIGINPRKVPEQAKQKIKKVLKGF